MMEIKRTLPGLILICFLFGICGLAKSAELVLKDGKSIKGKILEEKNDSVLLETVKGEQVKIPKAEIASIDYTDGKSFKQKYPITGVTIGFPALLNLVGGYYWKDFGLKISGGYWSNLVRGVQLNGSIKLIENKDFLMGTSLLAGRVDGPHIFWNGGSAYSLNYLGAGLEVNLLGFDLELNPTYSEGPGLFFLWQLGYVHRFN